MTEGTFPKSLWQRSLPTGVKICNYFYAATNALETLTLHLYIYAFITCFMSPTYFPDFLCSFTFFLSSSVQSLELQRQPSAFIFKVLFGCWHCLYLGQYSLQCLYYTYLLLYHHCTMPTHVCNTLNVYVIHTPAFKRQKAIGSCTLPIVSVVVYISRTFTTTVRPFHKTFFSICYCSLKPSFVSPSLEASYRSTLRLQSHTSSLMFPLQLQVVTPLHHAAGGLKNQVTGLFMF